MSLENESLTAEAVITEPTEVVDGINQQSVVDENADADTTAEDTTQDESSHEEDGDDANTETDKKGKSGFEKRIERFNKRLSAVEQEKEYWKKAAMGANTQATANTPPQPSPKAEPKFSDYNDVEAYTNAVTDWKIQAAIREFQAQQSTQVAQTSYQQRVNEFQKTHPDFLAVVSELEQDFGNRLPNEIRQTVYDSTVGPEMAYFLANNTAEVERIEALPPHRRLIELGKLEDRLSKPASTKVAAKVSKAPKPVSTEKGNAPVAKSLQDPNLSQAEYRELRMSARKRY